MSVKPIIINEPHNLDWMNKITKCHYTIYFIMLAQKLFQKKLFLNLSFFLNFLLLFFRKNKSQGTHEVKIKWFSLK